MCFVLKVPKVIQLLAIVFEITCSIYCPSNCDETPTTPISSTLMATAWRMHPKPLTAATTVRCCFHQQTNRGTDNLAQGALCVKSPHRLTTAVRRFLKEASTDYYFALLIPVISVANACRRRSGCTDPHQSVRFRWLSAPLAKRAGSQQLLLDERLLVSLPIGGGACVCIR